MDRNESKGIQRNLRGSEWIHRESIESKWIQMNPNESKSLLAKLADTVDLKDGLLNNRVCTVKILVLESYFSCNTTHTV